MTEIFKLFLRMFVGDFSITCKYNGLTLTKHTMHLTMQGQRVYVVMSSIDPKSSLLPSVFNLVRCLYWCIQVKFYPASSMRRWQVDWEIMVSVPRRKLVRDFGPMTIFLLYPSLKFGVSLKRYHIT